MLIYWIITDKETIQEIKIYENSVKDIRKDDTKVYFKQEETDIEETCFGNVYHTEFVQKQGFLKREYAVEELKKQLQEHLKYYKEQVKNITKKIKEL